MPVILDDDHKLALRRLSGYGDMASHLVEPVDDRVLDDGLKEKSGDLLMQRIELDIQLQADPLLVSEIHQFHIVLDRLNLFLQRDERVVAVNGHAQQRGQGLDQLRAVLLPLHRQVETNRIQHIEEKMRIDLRLKHLKLRDSLRFFLVPDLLDHFLDPIQHPVERMAKQRQVMPALDLGSPGQIPAFNLPRDSAQAHDRFRHLLNQGDQDQHEQGEEHALYDDRDAGHAVDLADGFPIRNHADQAPVGIGHRM